MVWEMPLLVGIFILNGFFVIVALISVRQSRSEETRDTKLKLAREYAELAYRFQEAFHKVRDPLIEYHEYATRPHKPDENSEERERLNERFAIKRRYEKLHELLPQMEAYKWETELVLNLRTQRFMDDYRELANDLNSAIERFYGKQFRAMVERKEVSTEVFTQVYDTVHGFSNDAFGKRASTITDNLAKALRESLS